MSRQEKPATAEGTLVDLKAALAALAARERELAEAREREAATAEVLRAISGSSFDLATALDRLINSACRLCEADIGTIRHHDGGSYRLAATYGCLPEWRALFASYSTTPHPGSVFGQTIIKGGTVHIPDLLADPDYARPEAQKMMGLRTALGVPLLRQGRVFGVVILFRTSPRPFTQTQIELAETFAAQAVIAIENARLLNELRETLERQTATSEVLSVISSSPGELRLVFDTILENATRICEAKFGHLQLYENGKFSLAAEVNTPPELAEYHHKRGPFEPSPGTLLDNVLRTKQVCHAADQLAEAVPGAAGRFGGARSTVVVPMLKDDALIGAITIYRQEVRSFTDKQIELVSNFAAQAVIAIENARLLNELRQRTDDLTESLEQQTATSEILQVISNSPTNTQPVFDTIVQSALRLFPDGAISIVLPDGDMVKAVASNEVDAERAAAWRAKFPIPLTRQYLNSVTILDARIVDIPDVRNAPPDVAAGAQNFLEAGYLAVTTMPMMRGNEAIGALSIMRTRPGPLTDKQLALVKTFAAQAVIAIENARLFNELRQRTADLQESLEYQTATSEILTVISRSPTDAMPVFDIIGERAEKLCDADVSVVSMVDGDLIRLAAIHGISSEGVEVMRRSYPLRRERETLTSRTVRSGEVIHVPDVLADPHYDMKSAARTAGYRGGLGVPMIRDGQVIGTIFVGRKTPGLYTDGQVQLLKTFADQAVIAIGNVRLFDEVQARTEDLVESLQQQTATADVLKVISRSTFDLPTVLDALLRSAGRLCDADMGAITQRKGDKFYRAVAFGLHEGFIDRVKDEPVELSRHSGSGRALLEGKVIQIEDVETDPDYTFGPALQFGKFRTLLGVPMLRDGAAAGVLTLMRKEVRLFTQKEIGLVATFADQAAIAIENVRLFDEIQDKSRQLEEASKHKSQFLANMSHELRTPLNAILGYTELIVDGVYGETPQKAQEALKRITTNGKHLLGLINDVLDLSKIEAGQLTLSLTDYSMKDVVHAVYGAVEPLAAEKKLTFKAEIAPDMPAGHGDERRLTQVLLNLVGNAIKFTDAGAVIIKASRDNGAFLVRVDDTGPGISDDDQKKLFQEFQQANSSTTKKKGGTGLGLAISKKIIELHGGKIWLESQVGKGSTFAFTVPARAEQTKRQA